MSHQETYRHNQAYSEFLANWDANFYAKYADTLKPAVRGAKVLDVGCGVGQVVARLAEEGFAAHGVDVSEPNIERAQKFSDRCRLYDGKKLPFSDQYFASVGALNVLEHVEEPEAFIDELVRVVEIRRGLLDRVEQASAGAVEFPHDAVRRARAERVGEVSGLRPKPLAQQPDLGSERRRRRDLRDGDNLRQGAESIGQRQLAGQAREEPARG